MPFLAILSIHPAPYRDCVFKSLYQRGMVKLMVWHYYPFDHGHKEWDWCPPIYPCAFSKYNYVQSPQSSIHLDILWQLASSKYDLLLVPGYSQLTSFLSIPIAIVRKKPIILILDSVKENYGSGLLSFFAQVLKNLVLRSCNAYWVPGFASSSYLARIGIRPSRVAQGSYCLDANRLSDAIETMRGHKKAFRNNLGIPHAARVVLAVGKMTAFRKYDWLISAWAALSTTESDFLLFVGDGPMYNDLVFHVKMLHLTNVLFAGPCSTEALPMFYALSDAFVHPGSEPYSTALEIAAIAGLPILANIEIGYVIDLLARGASPLLFESDNFEDLVTKLEILISDRYHSTKPGCALAKVAVERTPEWAASELESLVLKLTVSDL